MDGARAPFDATRRHRDLAGAIAILLVVSLRDGRDDVDGVEAGTPHDRALATIPPMPSCLLLWQKRHRCSSIASAVR